MLYMYRYTGTKYQYFDIKNKLFCTDFAASAATLWLLMVAVISSMMRNDCI